MSTPTLKLTSGLADAIERFLSYRRALGRRYDNEAWSLRLLDRYLASEGILRVDEVTPTAVDAFLASRPRSPRSYNALLGIVRNLFRWMVARRLIVCSPIHTHRRRVTDARIPFLFDADQARRLLQLAGAMPDLRSTHHRGLTYRMVFAVLYGLGLRVGEVLRLRVADVDRDRQLLVVRETKFGKSRLVPFGPVMAAHIDDYLARRAERAGTLSGTDPLFSVQAGGPLGRSTIGRTLRSLLPLLKLDLRPGSATPRIHDLRHSFAVGTLLAWYREGLDPATRLLHLSTFLGHAQPESTAVYLTITESLLIEAGTRFERYARGERGVAS